MTLGEKVAIGLQLTVYGTGLVFLVLAFLWGLMSLLLRLDSGEQEAETPTPARAAPEDESKPLSLEERVAVALAVLVHKRGIGHPSQEKGTKVREIPLISSWVAQGRIRQLRHPSRRRTHV